MKGKGWVKVLKDGRDTILRVHGEGGLAFELVFVGARSWATVRTMIEAVNLPGASGATLPDPVAVRVDCWPYDPAAFNERGPSNDK